MQPNSSSTPLSSSSIYINPKFRAHINPNFLSKTNGINSSHHHASTTVESTIATVPTQIYVNPRFFGTTNGMTQSSVNNVYDENQQNIMAHELHEPTIPLAVEPLADTKIHTRTKICNNRVTVANSTKIPSSPVNKVDTTKLLIKIGSKKLVRVPKKTATPPPALPSSFTKSSKTISKLRRPLQTKYKIVKEQSAFKIDRRSAKAKLEAITQNVLPVVASRKRWINESLTPTITITR